MGKTTIRQPQDQRLGVLLMLQSPRVLANDRTSFTLILSYVLLVAASVGPPEVSLVAIRKAIDLDSKNWLI
jgi:hypothetical protein